VFSAAPELEALMPGQFPSGEDDLIQPDGPKFPIIDSTTLGNEPDKRLVEALKALGVQIDVGPIVSAIAEHKQPGFDNIAFAVNQYAQISTIHERLSHAVYLLARKLESRNMNLPREGDEDTEESLFLEELMGDIARMPLSQDYALRLAFDKHDARIPPGPHEVVHVATGEKARCGGPGFCVVCDRGE
jgi:hypothetical protein